MRARLAATRWPLAETVKDKSQGVQLAKLQELVEYWKTDYDWRKVEARLNELPDVRDGDRRPRYPFIHLRSPHPNAMPMIMTHGWPGSILEFMKVMEPLTNPPLMVAAPKTPSISSCPPFPVSASQASRWK